MSSYPGESFERQTRSSEVTYATRSAMKTREGRPQGRPRAERDGADAAPTMDAGWWLVSRGGVIPPVDGKRNE